MKIKEIMTADVLSVGEDMPVAEVAEIISKNKIHAVPVLDENKKVVGIITETDFFTKDSANMVYMPSLIDFMKKGKLNYEDDDKEALEAVVNATAKDIMSIKCENISPDMELTDFIKLIKEKSFNSYPVVDNSGELVGIMTVADAIKLL
ncbi:MAG: CBS domain-containing protein [Candidatus Pacebacteria bacterium]|nr:CBS domain-containing protein [Candidatus Paceibacterota bacterium]MDR3583506.1 CBS domain-containing protein [Candidatus Paceibacterota bacterium]